MPILPYQKEAVEMMIQHENAMHDLYFLYAKKFMTHADFWHELAQEEDGHAATVAVIGRSLEKGKTNFSKTRFKTEAIRLSLRFIAEKIEQLKTESITNFNALTVALDIEKSLIENEYFIVLEDDSNELKATLRAMQLGAEKHLEKVALIWEKEKRVQKKD